VNMNYETEISVASSSALNCASLLFGLQFPYTSKVMMRSIWKYNARLLAWGDSTASVGLSVFIYINCYSGQSK